MMTIVPADCSETWGAICSTRVVSAFDDFKMLFEPAQSQAPINQGSAADNQENHFIFAETSVMAE
jgi:hypothetical protein